MYIVEILSLSVALQKGFGEVDGCNFVVAALMCTELGLMRGLRFT